MTMMWKALVLLAFVASTVIASDDSSNGDCGDTGSNIVESFNQVKSSSSSSSSSSFSYSSTSSSSDGTNNGSVEIVNEAQNSADTNAADSPATQNGDAATHNNEKGETNIQNEGGCNGDLNAHSGCGVNCGKTCSKNQICPRICKVGSCDCNDGFVFDSNVGKCVLPQECTPECGLNEQFDFCTNGGCGHRNCSQIGQPQICIDRTPESCIKGCVCVEGYLRAANGTCVPQDQCSPLAPECGLNEQFDFCTNGGCGHRNCSQVGQPQICIDRTPESCTKGCVCIEGYLRAENDTCVPQDQCPPLAPECGLNEQFDFCTNGGCGHRNCSQVGQPQICIDRTPESCTKGCVCIEGYLRAENDTCVPQDQCPPLAPECGLNEQFDFCTNGGCGHRNCSQVGQPQICIDRTPESCTKGCVCIEGYLRAENDTCVPQDQCPPLAPECGLNEQFYFCTNGGCGHRNCSQVGQPQICIDRTPESCTKGCVCIEGYLRAENDTCVPQDQCPPLAPECGLNEQFDFCTNGGCGHRNCSQVGQPQICIDRTPESCTKGCVCIEGYLRAENDTCVPQDQCPPLAPECGLNEQFDFCTNGGCGHRNCSQVGQPQICIDRTPESCTKGCVCIEGYLRAENDTCVPQDQCPPLAPECGLNEQFDFCTNGGCGHRNCSQVGQPQICIDRTPESCTKGCVCIEGYLRAENDTCVPQDQCPPLAPECGLNEQFDFCTNGGCGHRNCSQVGQPQICIDRTPESCTKGCVCIEGYLRAENDTCVPQDQCPPLAPECGLNEQFDFCTNGGCGHRNCSQVGQPQICIDRTPESCTKGCVCVEGYLRAENGTCVPQHECPPLAPECRLNEQFDFCTNGGCGHRNCSQVGQPQICIDRTPESCTKGCVCVEGYLRAENGTCVPQHECPPLAPECRLNEQFDFCTNGGCGHRNCSQVGQPQICIDRTPESCTKGCVCIEGYLRAENDTCVPQDQCPPLAPECGLNEQFDFCTNGGCGHRNCSQVGQPQICIDRTPESCTKGCVCVEGYLRAENGTCVPQHECPPLAATIPSTPVDASTTSTTTTTEASPSTVSGDNNGGDTKDELQSLEAGVTGFTGKFLYDRMKANQLENIIASPYSVFTPLAELALYAHGDSLKQLTSVLNLSSKQDIRSSFPALTASFDGQTNVNFSTAARVYANGQFPLSDEFKKDSADIFNAEAQELDFSQSTEAANSINAWVENKTNDRIKDLIAPSDLSSLTRLVLVNAIYFKGDWLYLFDKSNTKDADFYLSDGTTKTTKLMYQEANFNYGEESDLDCKVLEMPYKGQNFSMVIVLPNAKDGIMKTAEILQDEARFNKVLESMSKQKVQVYVPPFEIDTTTDLADILKAEGITKIFDEADSGLSGMLKTPEDIYVSKAIQKAFIKVDETGSEAAAANGVVIATRNLPAPPLDPKVFRADHAFLFFIRVKDTTLFCGSFIQ